LGNGRSVFGLIHADFHLDNVIFHHGAARPIDFDDCGFGYWLYDMAVTLWLFRMKPDWPVWREAFLKGYGSVRPLPTDQLEYLDHFIAAREISIGLWNVAMAQHNPNFRAALTDDLARNEQTIRRIFRLELS
jgi:Ser/Thr protein kinase RdoA (MazF antagonist)